MGDLLFLGDLRFFLLTLRLRNCDCFFTCHDFIFYRAFALYFMLKVRLAIVSNNPGQ